MTRPASAPVVTVLAALLLAGCSGGSGDVATTPSTTPPSSTAPTSTAPRPTPTFDAPATSPLGAGERAWAAFSDRTLAYADWWAALEPLLSPAARATYVYDDPRNLPDLHTTGKLRLAAKAPAEPRFTAEVLVPTDQGRFALDLERSTLHSPWLLYAIVFPPSVS